MGWNPFKAIGDFFEGVFDTIKNIGKAIFNFIGDVFSFVVAPFGAVPTPNVTANAGEEARGITVTKNGTTAHIPIVYGYRRIGGSIVFAETNGDTNKYLYVCYVLCQGEIEGVRRLFIDDIEIPTALMTATSNTLPATSEITINTGRFKNLVKLQVFNGATGDTQSSLLNGSNSWKNATRLIPGVAYLAVRYEYPEIKSNDDAEANPFKGGIPSIQAEVLGKKVYDIATLQTDSAGTELPGEYANLTKTYSINPVNHLLDYMLDPNFGIGLGIDEIDTESFNKSANKCLQYVEYYSGQSGRALSGNQVILTDKKLIDNTKEMVKACRGIMPYVQGQFKLTIEDGGNARDITSSVATIVYSVDDSDVISGISMRGEAKNTKFNQVVVNYIEPETDFQNQSIAYPETDSTEHVAALAEDNNEILKGEFNFPSITNKYIAQDLAKMIYEKSRTQRQVSFQAMPELMTVVPGDIINITNSRLGLSNQPFRVTGMNIRTDSSISIEAVEHIPTVYPYITTDEADVFETPKQPDSILPNPITPNKPKTPVGIVPPIDPDPNPPIDIDDGGATGGTDSAGNPVNPIQNPVPPKAPDETLMPDPADLVLVPGPGTFNLNLRGKYTASDRIRGADELIDFTTGNLYSSIDTIFNATSPAHIEEPTDDGIVNVVDQFNENAKNNFIAYRNSAVPNVNRFPFTVFQPIADNTGGGDNPYNTNGEYGGVVVASTSSTQPGDTLTVINAEDILYNYLDSAGFVVDYPDSQGAEGMLIEFSAAHGLSDGDIVKWTDKGAWALNARGDTNQLLNKSYYVQIVNSTEVYLHYSYRRATGEFLGGVGGFFFFDDQSRYLPTWSGTGTMQVVSISGPTGNSVTLEKRNTFEKIKIMPGCSIYNPYESWTRGQDLATATFTVSANLGSVPQCEFEKPTDSEILKRGPKGLYPKVNLTAGANGISGIVIYRGKVGGGLQQGGYMFNPVQTKYQVPGTQFEKVEDPNRPGQTFIMNTLGEFYAWPWAGGNLQGINSALLVQSNRDFFKIRFFSGRTIIADGSFIRYPNDPLYRDGSRPTPTSDFVYADPAMRYDLPGWTYTNEKGESVTGYGIEAYLNYSIQQLSADVFETEENKTTEHALGG